MANLQSLGIIIASQLILLARGEPQIAFPLNSQLPPVARIGDPFSFYLSRDTFQSDTNITYSLGEHPSWLEVDSSEGRLYGTPRDDAVPPGSVVGQTVEIIATDDNGSATMNSTLVVSRRRPLTVVKSMEEQISNFGHHSAPTSLVSYPSVDFSFTFDSNTFDGQSDEVDYYATSADGSPLPAWVKFDKYSLTFSGRTPPLASLIQPPQNFSMRLVASDIVGFAGQTVPFSIVVGSHEITTGRRVVPLNVTRGSKLSYDGLGEGVKLDDKQVKSSELMATPGPMPAWLTFNPQTWVIEGQPGASDQSVNFTIVFSDPFADSVEVTVAVNIVAGLFKSSLKDIELQPGKELDLDLKDFLETPADVDFKIDTQPHQDWLKVDGSHISGKVPKSAKGNPKMVIKATSKESGLSETKEVQMKFTQSSKTNMKTATSTDAAGETATNKDDSDAKADAAKSEYLPTSTILLATILPILALVFIVLLLAWLLRRRHARQATVDGAHRDNISRPIPDSLRINAYHGRVEEKNEKGGMVATSEYCDPSKIGIASDGSSISSRSRASETDEMPEGWLIAGSRKPPSIQSANSEPTLGELESRRSWVTIEDAGQRTSRPYQYRQSDATVLAESMHAEIYQAPYSSKNFRHEQDRTIPELEDVPLSPGPVSPLGHGSRMSKTFPVSMVSSAALPSPAPSSAFNLAGMIQRFPEPQPSTTAAADTEHLDQVGDLRTPAYAGGSSNWLTRKMGRTGTGDSGVRSSHADSFVTISSFSSSENWKKVGDQKGPGAGPTPLKNGINKSSSGHSRNRGDSGDSGNTQGSGKSFGTMFL